MTNNKRPFELSFWGGPENIKYRDCHKTYDDARNEAFRVLAKMSNRNAHPAIIYGPGMGKDGRTIV